jgi:hypothetical protein
MAEPTTEILRINQTLSAFDTELNSYLMILSKMSSTAQLLAFSHHPLIFWAKHAQALPILARLAWRFLSLAPTSYTVEVFFTLRAEYVHHCVLNCPLPSV